MPKVAEGFYKQIELEKDARLKLIDHFTEEINRAKGDRRELEERWERAHRLFEGRRTEKNFPWPGASNIHIPLVSSHVAAIHARFMTTLFTPEPFWRVRARNPETQDFSTAATEFMEWAHINQFDWYGPVRDFSLDAIKLGIGILKVTWSRKRGKVFRYDENYDIVEDDIDIEDQPKVEAVNPVHFLWPLDYDDIQTAPWICHEMIMTIGELKTLQSQGVLFNVDKLIGAESTIKDDVTIERDRLEGIVGGARYAAKIWEIWGRYDINGDGIEKEIQAIIEPGTSTILRLNPNPYFHRKRPFIVGRLEAREHRLVGSSVSDQIGALNEEINTVHNQAVDATTSGIIQMFKVRKGSPADIGDSLNQIYPAKKIPVGQMDDVEELSLGPQKVNSLPLEQEDRQYAERRTGISDFNLGREPSPSRRGTATGTLAIIQEGNKKFDFQIKDMRTALGTAGVMILELYRQMNPEGIVQEVLGSEAETFSTIRVVFPEEPLLKAISIEVVAGTASVNRQVQRQDAMTVFQIMTTFYQQAFQLGQLLSQPGIPPPLAEMAVRLAGGADVMMREILNSFENRRADELLPDMEEIFSAIFQQAQLTQRLTQSAGLQGAPGNVQGAGGPGQGQGAGGQAGPPGGGVPGAGAGGAGKPPGVATGSKPGGRAAGR